MGNKSIPFGHAPTEMPRPPKFHSGFAGFHFLHQIDFDGRPGGLEVYQWQPVAEKWCRPNEYASGRDLDLIGYEYVDHCALPLHEHEKEDLKKVMNALEQRFRATAQDTDPKVEISREEFDKLWNHLHMKLW